MRNGRAQEENRNSTLLQASTMQQSLYIRHHYPAPDSIGSHMEHDDTSAAGSYPFDEHDQNASGMAAIEAQLLPQLKSHIRSESKAVSRWRTIVFAILSMARLAVSLSVYFYVRSDERNDFEVQYRTNARKIVEVFHDIVERNLGALNTLSNTITSYAQDSNSTFPFVTLPHFAEHGSDFRILANTLIVRWMPMVMDEKREAWEAYALEHRHQIDESYESDTFYRDREDYVYSLPEYQHSRYLQENTTSTTATELSTGNQV